MAGRRGKNAVHHWYTEGVLRISQNTFRAGGDEYVIATDYPRLHIDEMPGWRSQPEWDDSNADKPVGRRGEYPGTRSSRGATRTVNGRVQALNEPDMMLLLDNLASAFTRNEVGVWIAEPWPGHGTEQWSTFAEVMACDIDEEQEFGNGAVPSPWQRRYVLSVRQTPSVWWWWNESGTPGQRMVYGPDAGEIFPANNGNAPTDAIDLIVTGVGAGQDVHVGQDKPGSGSWDLWFRDLPAGDLKIDFANRKAFVGLVDVTDKYDEVDSTWWDPGVDGMEVGVHRVWLGPGTGTGLRIEMFSAAW